MSKIAATVPFCALISIATLVDLRIGVGVLIVCIVTKQIKYITGLLACLAILLCYGRNYELSKWISSLPVGAYQGEGVVLEVTNTNYQQRVKLQLTSGYKVVATFAKYPKLQEADLIVLKGVIRPVDRWGKYEANYYVDGYFGQIENAVAIKIDARDRERISVCTGITQIATFEIGNFLCGVLVGEYKLAKNTEEMFTSLGLTHVLSVSGYNVTVIAAVLAKLAGKFRRRHTLFVTAGVLVVYLNLVGVANIPASRAVLMGACVVAAQLTGRPGSVWLSLIYANLLLFLANPLIYGSISWQLSMSALTGILMLTEGLNAKLTMVPAVIREEFAVSLSASLATAPVILIHFGGISPIAPIANLIMAPVIPLAMLIGFVLIMLSTITFMPTVVLWILEPLWLLLLSLLSLVNVYQVYVLMAFITVCACFVIYSKRYAKGA